MCQSIVIETGVLVIVINASEWISCMPLKNGAKTLNTDPKQRKVDDACPYN